MSGEHLVEGGQVLLVAGTFGRGGHCFLRLLGCVCRHYRSCVLGWRARGCQDVHHSGWHAQAHQEGTHHRRGLARGGEPQDEQVHEAGDERNNGELDCCENHACQRRVDAGVNPEKPQRSEADDPGGHGRTHIGSVGAQESRAVNKAVLARDPHDGDDALGESAGGFAECGGNDPPALTGQGEERPADDDLDDRWPDAHEEHGLDVLVGEEDALAHENHAGRRDARHEGGEDEGVGRDRLGIAALGGHCDLHHRHRTGHQNGGRHERQGGDRAHAQVVAVGHRAVVPVGDGTGHAGEDRRRQRDRDEGLGNHEDHERGRVGEDAHDSPLGTVAADEAVRHGGQVVRGQDADLRDAERGERPARDLRH